MNGELPPEVWAERDVAATLNLFDLGSDSRAVDADASEGGSGRGTPIVFSHTAGIDNQPSRSVAPTVKAGHDTMPSVATGTTVRRLTPVECERLQGLPDGWTETSDGKAQADGPRYRQLGNSVAVPCVEWIVQRLVASDADESGDPA